MTNSPENLLRVAMLDLGRDLLSLDNDRFTAWAAALDPEVVKLLLEKHRMNREFYKKILLEQHRVKVPNSARYKDADNKLRMYNIQGKILKTIIESN